MSYIKYKLPVPSFGVAEIIPSLLDYPFSYMGKIDTRFDIIIIILDLVTYLYNNEPITQICDDIILIDEKKDRYSRIIIYSKACNKHFSVYFPFYVNNKKIFYKNIETEINLMQISSLKSFYNEILKNKNFSNFEEILYDELADVICEYDIDEILLLKEIIFDMMMSEYSYIRFDNDEKNEKANHPRFHLDLFHCKKSTIKLGLREYITPDKFHEIINNDRGCHFIMKGRNGK